MMKEVKKKGLVDIPERVIYLLLIIVILVSVLGTLLVVKSVDNIVENSRENVGASVFDVSGFVGTGGVILDILPIPEEERQKEMERKGMESGD